MDYIKISEAIDLVIPIPDSDSGDTVTYEIIAASDGDVLASGSMTFLDDEMWKVSYTPSELGVIVLKANDSTITSKRENIYRVVGAVISPDGVTSSDLTTLANVRAFLGLASTDTGDDTALESLIVSVSQEIKNYTGNDFAQGTYTEYYPGEGESDLLLDHYPIQSITSCYDDVDCAWGEDTAVDVSDLQISDRIPGMIIYKDNVFEDSSRYNQYGVENVKITYVAGYATIPDDVVRAANMLVVYYYVRSKGSTNAPQGGKDPDQLKKDAHEILDAYAVAL